jgi:hypothetical protein
METLTKFSLSRNSDFGVWRFSTLRGSVLPKFFFSLNGAQERKGHLVFGIGCKPFGYRGFLFCLFRLCAVLCAVSSTTLEGSFSPSVSHRSSWLRGWVGVTVEGPKIVPKRIYS